MNTPLTLSPKQQAAKQIILDWLKSPGKQTFKLGGYAGTGKTTLIREILDGCDCHAVTTSFTGKAVSVLKKKGVSDAQTMHSFLYTPEEQRDGSVTFRKKTQAELEQVDFIINDESSMVSTDLYNDLLSTGAKVLFVGDPGQLEPVGDNPNLMKDCNLVLTEIHRQAASSPILQLATKVRLGDRPQHCEERTADSRLLVTNKEETLKIVDEVDQLICGMNKTRVMLNTLLRTHYGRKGLLCEGEKLICLRNNAKLGVFNGMILFVERIRVTWADNVVCDLKTEDGKLLRGMKLNTKCLTQGDWKQSDGKVPFDHTLFTYGYCITCHKSQGSEWEKVAVYDQANCPFWSAHRWRYTAITRAAKELVYGI